MVGLFVSLKAIHVGAVALSVTGFFTRGLALLAGANWVQSRPVRLASHLVDTVLLASACTLAWMLGVSPLTHAWLAAKVLGVFVYVGLGLWALRFGRNRVTRASAWLCALVTFAYIVSVALTKDVRGWLPR